MRANTWRWAWNTLTPAVTYIDIEQMRRVLIDHLEAQAATIDGRTAIPFVLSTVTDKLQWNWTMAAMGFVGKEIECADQLLREGVEFPFYWYALYPMHYCIFKGMLHQIAAIAQRESAVASAPA